MTVTAPPRAGTAIAAGALAVLGGLWFLLGIFWWSLVLGFGQSDLLVPGQLADAVIGLLLLLGGGSLLARVEAGRVLCLAAGALALVAPIVGMVLRYQRVLFVVGGPTGIDPAVPRGVVVAAPFVALLVLAALPATRRWTRH
ncbi:hypothetical protein [Amycolatopsis vancoresmycina]|uniref:Uncharacterized protein n=1 Tax=Amycolatopsis vancoresmycina DSM 44592 TaxID=1292037 RepID=R1FGJ4_9PSEU|nr:hypothetical protein [Amycolatopsis vancoresmycina]EOD58738.1 hypothetical protein H480_42665 [Amycolatopsis vancoresmycina DSM 44592]